MEEVLDAVEVAEALGLEGVFAWLLRIVGLLALVAGLYLWLGTEMGLLILPAVLLLVGVVLLVAPSVLLFLTELT
jgi:hypothetical protein